jgi:NOL1/NOP2/sun family putative RNA methylase
MTDTFERLSRYRDLVDDWSAFIDACRRPLPMILWANPLRQRALLRLGAPGASGVSEGPDGRHHSSDADCPSETDRPSGPDLLTATTILAERLEARGYSSQPVDWYPGALRVEGIDKPGKTLEFFLGLYHVQEEISLLPALLLAAEPGQRVLDLCAAPGGKTAQIACHMENTGTLVANDIRPNRLRALRSNCERLGLLNVAVSSHDGTRFPLEVGQFDRVLLDVPCSCEGNVRQSGKIPFEQAGGVRGRAGLQATLLGRAWKLLSPGGVLVYSTCTFAPEENELVLDYVLGEDATIEPVEVEGLRASAGVSEWNGRGLRSDCCNVARFWPHLNDTGGFAAARIRKQGEAP